MSARVFCVSLGMLTRDILIFLFQPTLFFNLVIFTFQCHVSIFVRILYISQFIHSCFFFCSRHKRIKGKLIYLQANIIIYIITIIIMSCRQQGYP